MLTLEEVIEQVDGIQSRVDSVEAIFGRFIAEVGSITRDLERNAEYDRRIWRERFEQSRREWQERFEQAQQVREADRKADHQEWQERFEQAQQVRETDRKADHQEWQERFEQAQQVREADRKADRKEWNQRWGELANRLGTIAEDIVAPTMPGIARKYFGITDIIDFMVRRKVRNKNDPSQNHEFDVIVVGVDKVIINETKSTPRINYIDDFIATLKVVGEYLPEYSSKTIIPVFASLYLPADVVNYLTKHNIYAMAMAEEAMDLVNFRQLQNNVVTKS